MTQGNKIPLNAFQLLASVDFIEFHTLEAYSSYVLIRVKFNTNVLSRVENE